jgi:predicted Zn-dependent protease
MYVFLDSGLFEVFRDEQDIAIMLSHALGHIYARHKAESISKRLVSFAALLPAIPLVFRIPLWVLRLVAIGPWTKAAIVYSAAVIGLRK